MPFTGSATRCFVVIVSTVVTAAPIGVTDGGEKDPDEKGGRFEAENETGFGKPFAPGVIVMVAIAGCPAVALTGVDGPATVKSIPVPESKTVCGLPAALSVIESVAIRLPVATGVNVRLTTQFAPTGTDELPVQVLLLAMAKSAMFAPLRATPVMLSAEPPELVTITVCAELAVPRP